MATRFLARRGYASVARSTPANIPGSPVSAEEAVKLVPKRSRVYVHSFSATPFKLLDALSKREDVDAVELFHYGLQGPNACAQVEEDWQKQGKKVS